MTQEWQTGSAESLRALAQRNERRYDGGRSPAALCTSACFLHTRSVDRRLDKQTEQTESVVGVTQGNDGATLDLGFVPYQTETGDSGLGRITSAIEYVRLGQMGLMSPADGSFASSADHS